MRIENIFRKGHSVSICGKTVVFDETGTAEADEQTGAKLLTLSGYRAAGGERPQKAAEPAAEAMNLESLSMTQLKKLAKERGIDIGDATKKAELIERIRKTDA